MTSRMASGSGPAVAALLAAAALSLLHLTGALPDWLHRLPETAQPPLAEILDAIFAFVQNDLGLIHVTRWLAEMLEFPLDAMANLLHGKRRWPFLGPVPWAVIATGVAVLGYALGGWRLAALAGGTALWIAVIGQWDIAMQTVSVLSVSVPLAIGLGIALGIAAWKSPRVDATLRPVLSLLQTLPFFTYLLPAVIFFKVGPTAGAVATIVYAMPPMVLMTTLGLRQVPSDVVEAGQLSGLNRRQMLTRVYLPTARTEILVGVNQVIMLSLAMVVLTAFIGMPGLGAKLLAMMGSFKLGRSLEIGISIVLLAVTLDRLSKAWITRLPVHHDRDTPWHVQHRVLLSGVALCLAAWALAQAVPYFAEVGRRQSLSQGRELDALIKAALDIDAVQAVTTWLRGFLNLHVLIPFREFLLWFPTPAMILFLAAASWLIGGRRPALFTALFFGFVAASGWWDRAMITLYTVLSAVALAVLIGLPAGIAASRSEAWSRRILLVCDTAQTFPSFIYLIPAIMLFGVNDVAVVSSIVIFATVPLCRYTIEGLRSVPASLTEAAEMSGATARQKLFHVELPMALPTMVVGFNQAIMFAFFMVIVAAFIGTQDLGQELQRTLAGTELGKNLVLGLDVALMALSFDITLSGWTRKRREAG